MSQLTPLTRAEIHASQSVSLWVVNTAYAAEKANGGGRVLIQVPLDNGLGSKIVRVEETWLPQDLAAQAPRNSIIVAANFLSSLSEGLIIVVSDDDAATFLESPKAVEEQQRLRAQQSAVRNAELEARGRDAGVVSIGGEKVKSMSFNRPSTAIPPGATTGQRTVDFDDPTVEFDLDSNHDEFARSLAAMGSADASAAMKNHGPFNAAQLAAVVEHARHDSIVTWARNKLSQLAAP